MDIDYIQAEFQVLGMCFVDMLNEGHMTGASLVGEHSCIRETYNQLFPGSGRDLVKQIHSQPGAHRLEFEQGSLILAKTHTGAWEYHFSAPEVRLQEDESWDAWPLGPPT